MYIYIYIHTHTHTHAVCKRMPTYADVCRWRCWRLASVGYAFGAAGRRLLTYADVCWRMQVALLAFGIGRLCSRRCGAPCCAPHCGGQTPTQVTYADVCWRMLTCADALRWPDAHAGGVCWRMLPYADVRWRMLTHCGGRTRTQVLNVLASLVLKYKYWHIRRCAGRSTPPLLPQCTCFTIKLIVFKDDKFETSQKKYKRTNTDAEGGALAGILDHCNLQQAWPLYLLY
jgi:hypothetical protein